MGVIKYEEIETEGYAEMAAVDHVRAYWFEVATSGRMLPRNPGAEKLNAVRSERDTIRQEEGTANCAYEVANAIEMNFDFPAFEGVYLAPNGEPIALHAWNLLADGTILDASADRFGEGRDIVLIRPSDPNWRRYRPEWTAEKNPITSGVSIPGKDECWNGITDLELIAHRKHQYGDTPWWLESKDAGPYDAFCELDNSLRRGLAATLKTL